PAASSHWPKAKPIATGAAAAATSPAAARRSAPVSASPIAAPRPARMPIVYQSPTSTRLQSGRTRAGPGRGRLPSAAPLLLVVPLRPVAPDGEPRRPRRAQGALAGAGGAGRRRGARRARGAARGRAHAAHRPGHRPQDGRAHRGPRERAGDRGAPRPSPGAGCLGPWGFQPGDHGERELGGARAVDHTVVERDADVADRARDDLAVADDRPLGDAMDAEDGDLGMVDERRDEHAAELAGARDGERRAAQLSRHERARAGAFGEPVDIGPQLLDGARVAGPDDRHDEPPVGLDGDAEVVALEVDDLVALEARVQLRERAQL